MVGARLLDCAGRRRSPASLPGFHAGRIPRNKGQRYPADPLRTEIISVMRCADENLHGDRVRALIVILWRAGLPIQEALSLTELDLDPRRGSVLVRRGKRDGGARPAWTSGASNTSKPGSRHARRCRSGPPFCVLDGRTRGRAWSAGAAREALRLRAVRAGVRRRFAPHQLRHAHAIELAREGVPLNIIQRQLGDQNLDVTSIYLRGIDPGEIIETIHARRAPMIPLSAGLDLRR